MLNLGFFLRFFENRAPGQRYHTHRHIHRTITVACQVSQTQCNTLLLTSSVPRRQ